MRSKQEMARKSWCKASGRESPSPRLSWTWCNGGSPAVACGVRQVCNLATHRHSETWAEIHNTCKLKNLNEFYIVQWRCLYYVGINFVILGESNFRWKNSLLLLRRNISQKRKLKILQSSKGWGFERWVAQNMIFIRIFIGRESEYKEHR